MISACEWNKGLLKYKLPMLQFPKIGNVVCAITYIDKQFKAFSLSLGPWINIAFLNLQIPWDLSIIGNLFLWSLDIFRFGPENDQSANCLWVAFLKAMSWISLLCKYMHHFTGLFIYSSYTHQNKREVSVPQNSAFT